MRKSLLVIIGSVFMGGVAWAQEPQSASMSETDSLQQVVAQLTDQVEEAQEAERNEAIWKDRAKYFNIGYVSQRSKPVDPGLEYRSNLGVSLVWGKTFYLHKKPLARMIKFGIDFSWMDINYAKYDKWQSTGNLMEELPEAGGLDGLDDLYDQDEVLDAIGSGDINLGAHQLEYGLQVGPSVTINPVDHLKISAYFRFVPSASLILLDDNVSVNYATFFTAGGAVSWRVISLGVEGRWGQAKYKNFSLSEGLVDSIFGESSDGGTVGKIKRKTSAIRVYLSFRF